MKAYVNDRQVEFVQDKGLEPLLRAAGIDPDAVAVTVDGKFLPRSAYRAYKPREGARIRALELHDGG